MFRPSLLVVLACCALPAGLAAQQRDTAGARPDTAAHPAYQLQAITVTSTPTRRGAPVSSTEVPAPAVRRALSTSTTSWELLRQAAGLEVHQQGQGPGFASDASVRGFSSDHSTDLALWIDGVPVNEPVNGHAEGYNDWSLLFPQSIADIEVIKGPTSPLFGNFALAGVVNVRTLQGMQGSRGWVSGGSFGRASATLLSGFDHGGSSGVLGIRAQRDGGWRVNDDWRLGQAYGKLVRNLSPSVAIDGGVNLYGAGWQSPGFLTLAQYDAGSYDVVADRTDGGFKRRAQERVSLRVQATPSMMWRSTLYSTQGRWQLYLTTPPEGGLQEGTGSQTEEEDRRYGFGLTSALTWVLPHVDLTVGTQERLDHSDYQNWLTTRRVRDEPQLLVSARQMSGGVFVASDVEAGPLRLNLGGRWDVLSTRSAPTGDIASSATKGTLSPKVGALLSVHRGVAVYGNVSRGFRQTDGVIEDPSLPFITEWAYESGVKLSGGPGYLGIALFRMNVSNEQTFNPITLATTSGGASRRQGIEIDGRVEPLPLLAASADVTFNDARYLHLVTEDGDTLNGARVYNTAKYVGSAALDYGSPDRIQLRLATNLVGPYSPFDEPGVVLPGYALLHASAGRLIGRVLLEAGVRNLLDRKYPELRAGGFVSPGQPRAVEVTARMVMP